MINMKFCGDLWLPTGSSVFLPENLTNDLVINLESPLIKKGEAIDGKICLRSDPDVFHNLFKSPPLAVCLANNHIMDYGEQGFDSTLKELDSRNIPYFGAGSLGSNCNNPLILNVEGVNVALMGYVCKTTHPIFATKDSNGVAPIDLIAIEKDIAIALNQGAERLVVCLHWGDEEVSMPKSEDIDIAAKILELGVDLIIGHHAHCRQPIMHKINKNSTQYVFFGLGNAFFPDFNYTHQNGDVSWKHQRSWNKSSTWVDFSPKTTNVSWKGFCERGGTFIELSGFKDKLKVFNFEYFLRNQSIFNAAFKRAKRFSVIRNVVSRFCYRPKIPSMKSLLYVFSSIFN